jgi:hypothetical protein
VLAENEGGAAPWYLPVDSVLQQTPYRFESQEELSCDLERGDTTNPMLLLNHWLSVDPASPVVAEGVNAADVLHARFERCHLERGRRPNIIAVDFYVNGDLLDVVAELNGVTPVSTT